MASNPPNPVFDFANWAMQAAPYLAPPTAPLAWAAQAAGLGKDPTPITKPAPEEVQIGAEKDFGRLVGTKVYTGPAYGYQTVDTALGLNPAKASPEAMDQAEFRRVQQVLRSNYAAAKKPPAEKPPSTVDQRGTETPTPTGIPGQKPASQATDPQQDVYNEMLKKLLDPEYRAKLAAQDTEQAVRRALITNALAMRQTRENTQRQVQLKNIESWKELERARIEANTRQAIALQSTIAASMLPNQGLMAGMSAAYQAAMAPFQSFTLS